MKKVLPIVLLCVNTMIGFSQTDTLFFKDGAVISSNIVEVTQEQVKYLKADNPDGPNYIAAIADLKQITYRNGKRELYVAESPAIVMNQERTINQKSNYSGKTSELLTEKNLKFNGPRLGVGYVGAGMYADELSKRGKSPILTQIGWQFETRIFTSASGLSGLVEFVPMISGIEQGLFYPSASFLIGIRSSDKFEVGLGPTLAYPSGLSMAFALGTSVKYEDVYFPITLAFVPNVSKKTEETLYNGTKVVTVLNSGFRVSLLIGFITRNN